MSIRFRTKTKNIGHYEFSGFIVDFYGNENIISENKVCINTVSKNFSATLTDYTFGYLLTSVKDGDTTELHSFCVLLYCVATGVYKDAGFSTDIIKSITKYFNRLEKKATTEAKKTTESDEQAAQALMEDIISEQNMSKKELAEKRKQDKEILRDMLKEKGEGEIL